MPVGYAASGTIKNAYSMFSLHKLVPIFVCALLSCKLFAQEVSYTSEHTHFLSHNVKLSGSIYSPPKPQAALVIVHGSGKEKRMVDFAKTLASEGFCVLTYDKRGVGESEGIYAGPEVGTNNVDSANLQLLADDASAAINHLSAYLGQQHLKLGLIGGSQAGWIIPIAAKENPKVNFMVIFSGALVTALEQLRFQFFTEGKPNFWANHTEAEVRMHIANDPDRYAFVDTDPNAILQQLSTPGLWIFGGKDVQAPVGLSIEQLEKHIALKKPYTYYLFPELGHNTAFTSNREPINKAVAWIRKVLEGI